MTRAEDVVYLGKQVRFKHNGVTIIGTVHNVGDLGMLLHVEARTNDKQPPAGSAFYRFDEIENRHIEII